MPICQDCLEQSGLCRRHVRDVCPQLAQPFWLLRLMGDASLTLKDRVKEPDPRADKVRRRKERKRNRRLARAIAGEHTRSRPEKAVAA